MLEGLAWLRDHSEAYCITFARGLNETELLRRFGGNLAQARLIRYDDWEALDELRLFGDVIQVGFHDGWAFAYEDNGFIGTPPEVLSPVSAGTVAISVFRNVNAVARFCYAEDTTIVADFDPIDMPFDDPSPQVQALLHKAGITREMVEGEEEEEGFYDFEDGMFALAEAAGARLDRASLTEKPLLTSFIRNPVSDFIEDVLTHGGDEQTADRLLALLSDPQQGYGRHLLTILNRELSEERQPRIRDDRPIVERLHEAADEVLRALLSAQVTPVLLKALDQGDQHLQSAVLEMLNMLVHFDLAQDDEAAQERLRALASAPEPLLKVLAAENLRLHTWIVGIMRGLIEFDQKHDGEAARERLLALISAPDIEVASSAALALGTLGDQRAVEPLLHILNRHAREEEPTHYPYSPAQEAVQLLGQLRAASSVQPLLNLLRPQDEEVDPYQDGRRFFEVNRQNMFQRDLLNTLGQIGGAHVVEGLLPLLNPQAQTQYVCSFQQGLLAALAQTGDPQVVEPLLNLLDPKPTSLYTFDFQLCLLKALGDLGDQRAIEPLARLLQPDAHHPYAWRCQERLAETLRRLGDTRAELQAVELAVQDRHKTARLKSTLTVRKQQEEQSNE